LLSLGIKTGGACGTNGNKLPAANSSSQYTKKGSFYRKNSPEAVDPPFYKRLQLVYLDLSRAGDEV
jgi:hypothetical protein